MSTFWCTVADVEDVLTFLQGASQTSGQIQSRIVSARDYIIQELGSFFSTTELDTWTDENSVPPQVRRLATMEAAARFLQECVDGESIGDRACKSYGFRREVDTTIKRIREGELVITESRTDSTPVSAQDESFRVSTHGTDPVG